MAFAALAFLCILLITIPKDLLAQETLSNINSASLMSDVMQRFETSASKWAERITDAASWLFWTLATISMVWTFGTMALRKADIGEFLAELTRFTLFTSFFWWILVAAPEISTTIIASFRQLGGEATKLGSDLDPGLFSDIGFQVLETVVSKFDTWEIAYSFAGIIFAVGVLICTALISANMIIMICSGWILAYAGIFFLGFGGSRWTSEFALNYYKAILQIGAQLFSMVLLAGMGYDMLNDYFIKLNKNKLIVNELGVMFIVSMVTLVIANKVPALISGLVTGGSIGNIGGTFSGGDAIKAASAVASAGGSMLMGAAGGAKAVSAAAEAAKSDNSSATSNNSGSGGMLGTGQGNQNAGGASPGGGGGLNFAQAAGIGGGGAGQVNSQGKGSKSGAARAGRIAAGTVKNLAKGAMAAGKQAVNARIDKTVGGKIAKAIQNRK